MKNLHSDHLLDTLLTQAMEDALSTFPPWQETEASRKAEDVLASLPKKQNDSLRSYLNEIAEQEAAEKQALYLQGILDGIALAGIVQREQHIACEEWTMLQQQHCRQNKKEQSDRLGLIAPT